jgi:predicted nucleic acid-binding protein
VALTYIADKSAFARQFQPTVRAAFEPLLLGGLVARCGIFELETLFSARNPPELIELRQDLAQGMPLAETRQVDFDRAVEVIQLLASKGLHRSVPIPDLILSAVAERHGLTVLHYDQDYETIADVTGQQARWIVPRGSVD